MSELSDTPEALYAESYLQHALRSFDLKWPLSDEDRLYVRSYFEQSFRSFHARPLIAHMQREGLHWDEICPAGLFNSDIVHQWSTGAAVPSREQLETIKQLPELFNVDILVVPEIESWFGGMAETFTMIRRRWFPWIGKIAGPITSQEICALMLMLKKHHDRLLQGDDAADWLAIYQEVRQAFPREGWTLNRFTRLRVDWCHTYCAFLDAWNDRELLGRLNKRHICDWLSGFADRVTVRSLEEDVEKRDRSAVLLWLSRLVSMAEAFSRMEVTSVSEPESMTPKPGSEISADAFDISAPTTLTTACVKGPSPGWGTSNEIPIFAQGLRDDGTESPLLDRPAIPVTIVGAALRERLATHMFGDGAQPFTLELISVSDGVTTSNLRYELEIAPPPLRNDLDLVIAFPGQFVRKFRLEIPPEVYAGEPARSRTRSDACDPLPDDRGVIQGILESAGALWPATLRLS